MTNDKAERIEYLERVIEEKTMDSNCIDRKRDQECATAYNESCREIRLLESILEVIKNEEE